MCQICTLKVVFNKYEAKIQNLHNIYQNLFKKPKKISKKEQLFWIHKLIWAQNKGLKINLLYYV